MGKTGETLIVTVARQGYQFTADVIELDSLPPGVGVVPGPGQRPARISSRMWRRDMTVAAVALAVVAGASIAWQRSRAGSSSGATVRLAVLPFANLTGDSTQEYLADGLTEELTTQLARLRPGQLGVIARTSVMRYKHGDKPLDEIGRDLSVAYALESSLRRSADRLRVTVQLIRIRDQSHIWANDFDYPQADVFRIEDSVAAAVGREVQLRLTPARRDRLTRAPPTNWRAVDAVMRGRDHLVSQGATKGGWEAAKGYFDQAIGLDSTYALAWAWLSATCRYGVSREYMPTDSGYREARQTVSRALVLDPNLPEAWEQLGQLQLFVDWDWAAANTSFQRALELDPGSVKAIERFAFMRETLGDVDEAIALNRRALELDPLDGDAFARLSWIYYNAGRFDEAERSFEMLPLARRNADYLGVLLDLAKGRVSDAATAVVQVADSAWQQFDRVLVLDRQGRWQAADTTLSSFIGRHQREAAYQIAELYAFRREPDSAFAWLDRAYAQRDQGLPSIKSDLFFKGMHDDPRYGALLRKMRLPA